MDKDHIFKNIQWLQEAIEEFNKVNCDLSLLPYTHNILKSQIDSMLEIIRIQVKRGNLDENVLINLEQSIVKNSITEIKDHKSDNVVKGTALCNLVYLILNEEKKPMYHKNIVKIINEKGYIVNGNNPELNLTAHLTRDKRFIRAEKRGYYKLIEWDE